MTVREIGIFGSSGFAREVADIAITLGYRPFFIAQNKRSAENISESDVILESEIKKFKFPAYAIGVGDNRVRKTIFQKFSKKLHFPNLVHPNTSFGMYRPPDMTLCQGTIICSGTIITNSIIIGSFSIFNMNCTIGHDCFIGDFVNIAPGANISGYVKIKNGSHIGSGATVLQGKPKSPMVISEQCVIGAGAVVNKDCEASSTYIGIPARKIK